MGDPSPCQGFLLLLSPSQVLLLAILGFTSCGDGTSDNGVALLLLALILSLHRFMPESALEPAACWPSAVCNLSRLWLVSCKFIGFLNDAFDGWWYFQWLMVPPLSCCSGRGRETRVICWSCGAPTCGNPGAFPVSCVAAALDVVWCLRAQDL